MRKLSIPFKVFIIVAGTLGLCLEFSSDTAILDLTKLRMFTCLSNLAVVIYYIVHVIFALRGRSTERLEKWKVLITLGIVLTGLVAHFMLRDVYLSIPANHHPIWWIQHYVVPISTFIDWAVFDARGRMQWWMPLFATIFPLAYCTVTMFYVGVLHIGDYPYPFLDVNTLGVGPVLLAIVGLSVGFIVVGYLLYGIDHTLAKRPHA